MDVHILKEEKDFLELELKGETHTLCNLLRKELWENNEIAAASYNLKHPLISIPVFTVRAKSGKPKKHLQEAITSLKKQAKELHSQVQKIH